MGPFTYGGVVAFHYGVRIKTMSIIVILTFKTGLNILFIWDFDRIASIPELKVMAFMFVSTLVSTAAQIIDDNELSFQYLRMMLLLTLFTYSPFLWNNEARHVVLHKWAYRKSRRIGIGTGSQSALLLA